MKNEKTFCLRIDVESQKGITEGLPKILDLLKKHNIKASFYLTMGGESSLWEIIRYRKKLPGERKIQVFSTSEKIRMLLFPRDFVGENKRILKRVLSEGHELGIHGWKHRKWSRGLSKKNAEHDLELAVKRYKKLFRENPLTFSSPAFQINSEVLKVLEKKEFRVISDLDGEKPFKIRSTNIINVPITVTGKNKTPIIEYLAGKKFDDEKILDYLKKETKKKKLTSIYIHDLFECRFKLGLLSKFFDFLKKNKIKVKTIEGVAKTI